MPTVEPIGLVLVGAAIVVGLVGIVLVVIPGLLLVWGAVAVWALVERTPLAWGVLVLATVLALAGTVVKYVLPGRRMRDAGVPTRSIVVGSLLGIVGFFLIPVVGLFIGFVLGIYLAERVRLPSHGEAWPSTVHALKALGLSILIELLAGLLIAGSWLLAAIVG
ncbi:MAG TPA: DUF456 domain-containing protein [Jiangellaceae bacterium]|jgi:uncharacterized protein|nr:DUF456 domain-containing protein [Jiangellaceae bacterium]